jgi:hypothetical protein
VFLGCLAFALAGCTADADRSAHSGDRSTRATTQDLTTVPSTRSTQPAATDVEGVRPALSSLMSRYDDVVSAVLADPRVASDPSDPRVRAYLALFPAGSAFATSTVQSWVALGQQGRSYAPGPRGRLYETEVTAITPGSADEASFTTCTRTSVVVHDGSGTVVESQGGVSAGSVVAVRRGGQWLLRDLTESSPTGCPQPAASR